MPDYAVNTAFNASGDILRKLTTMTDRVSKFGRTSRRSFDGASRSASNFKSTLSAILAAGVINKGMRGLEQGLRSVTSQFIDYDQAIVSASAKFKGLNLATEQGQATMNALKASARELGATTEFSAAQAAQGLDFLAMAGFNAEQAMIALPGIVDLATVANIDLARATDIASDALGAYGLMTEDSIQLEKNFIRTSDVMAKTVTMANTDMETLFETIKKGGSSFVGAGQSMETFSALAASLANNGLKGGEAGTALRNIMLRLAKPTSQAADLLKQLNVQTQDSSGNFVDAIDILDDFRKGLNGMGTAQRSAALKTVFGEEAITGINLLLGEGTEKLRDYRKELVNSSGASKRMADVMRGSIGNQLRSLGSAASEMGFKFFDAFESKIIPSIQALTEFIRNIDVSAMVNGVTSIINVVVRLKGAIFALVGALAAYKLIMAGMAIAAFVKNFVLLTRALRAAVLAQGLLNTVMMLNPIGLIVAGIALLIGGLWLLVDNFDVVSDAIVGIFKWLGDVVMGILDFFMTPYKMLWEGMKKIIAFFKGDSGDDQTGDVDFNTASDRSANIQETIDNRQAPNQAQLEAQQVNFNGQLNITGAPTGSTFEDKSKAPVIRTELVGVQM